MKIYYIIISFLVLSLQTVVAQNPFITNYTIADGLPSNKIYCSFLDKSGFMWFGTDVGVVRFDGSNFVNYTKEDGLSGDLVVRMKEDFEGRLWFLNLNGTINYFYENTIFNAINAPFLGELKTNVFIHDFFQDEDSTLYFYNSVSEVFVVKNNELIDYRNFNLNNRNDIALYYFSKTLDDNFRLWTAPGIYEFNEFDDAIKLHKHSFLSQKVLRKNENETYVLGQFGYLNLFNGSKIYEKNILKLETQLIHSILEDEDGFMWISTFDKGIYCYKGDSVVLHFDIPKTQNLIIDNENNIWVVSNVDGIYKISRDILKYKFLGKHEFSGEGITDLAFSNQEGIWATNGKSLYYILDNQSSYPPVVLRGSIIDNIHQLKNNTIILSGTSTNLFIIENVNVKSSTIDYNIIGGLNFRVNRVAIDSSEEFLYSNISDKLFVTELKRPYRTRTKNINRGRINNIFFNRKDNLIINAANNYCYTDSLKFAQLYKLLEGQIISSHIVINNENELINVKRNKLYLLNNEKLYDLTKQFKSQIDYRIKDMIYNGSILFFFTIKTVYFISNPLKIISGEPLELNRLNIEFNNINDLYCQDSTLFVASDDGITFIPVKECVNIGVHPPKPYFYRVSLDDENYDISSGIVEFKSRKRLSIEFSSLNFSSIPSNYSYMLEGIDNNWINGNEKRVVYLNLEPGNYSFKLKSRTNREEYSNVIELPVIVKPTIFQRIITKVILVLLLLLLISLIIHFRYQRKIKQKETEHLLITLENKALQSMMNPHFIFNALGSIQGFLLQNRSVEAGTYLSQFARLIRQNMNSLKSNFICIDDEVDRLRNYIELERLRMNDKFTYQIEVDEQIDSYEVCIPSMVVQPFVENAIWHGISSIDEGGLIKIIFNGIDENSIEVLVEDNGIGIKDTETFSESGSGLNMGIALTKKRLKLIGDRLGIKSEVSSKNLNPGTIQTGTQIRIIIPIVDDTI